MLQTLQTIGMLTVGYMLNAKCPFNSYTTSSNQINCKNCPICSLNGSNINLENRSECQNRQDADSQLLGKGVSRQQD